MRCGREVWPPRPVSRTWTGSAAAVIGPSRSADRADVERGVAVQGEDPARHRRARRPPSLQRAAGHDLLGRLEDQAHPPGQQPAHGAGRQREARAQQRGGVDVVPARVADAGHRRSAHGDRRHVVQRQGVEVGAQRRRRSARLPDVARSGRGRCREQLRRQPGRSRRSATSWSCASLVRELGVGVQVAPEGDQLVVAPLRTRSAGGARPQGERGHRQSGSGQSRCPSGSSPARAQKASRGT